MKFAHLADCHLGGWREPELRKLGVESFDKAIDICIKENVAFALIAGDLFNNALPPIELLKEVVHSLNKLKEADINCYLIPGSHDFSVSGKTMLDVLEKASLVENVMKVENNKLKFTIDKTNTKITGLFGLRGGLDKTYYDSLDMKDLEKETGLKIFLFHMALEEYKPKELEKVECGSVNKLPKNFNYYAGGHPHYIFQKEYSKGILAYPGPLFPNNFAELEKLNCGGFYIVNIDNKAKLDHKKIKLKDVATFNINVDGLNPLDAEKKILNETKLDVKDKIVTLRISGVLNSGKISDINFNLILDKLKDAYVVLKNTNALTTKEFEEVKIEGNVDDIEKSLIRKYIEENKDDVKESFILSLMTYLSLEKEEGETNDDFQRRLLKETSKVIRLE